MSLLNIIRREVQRFQAMHNREQVGLIDSYRADDHTAKVKFLTEVDVNGNPRITGWLPFKVAAGGQGASWVIAPQVGDQCVVSYLENDSETGVISGFLHNTQDQAPTVQPSEAVLRHTSTGNYIKLRQDGSITANITNTQQQHYLGGDPDLGHIMLPVVLSDGTHSPYVQARKS